ncbi:hypothetical protein [Streptomyces caelestis]|uniref:hypothetical protein n=1 Tax=Streptomyces caelestis TaxID=36816 RepID=UPI00365A651B
MRIRIALATVALALAAVAGTATAATAVDDPVDGDVTDTADQFGLINFGNDSDLLSMANLCGVEDNVIAIPVLSENSENPCIGTDDTDDSDGVD